MCELIPPIGIPVITTHIRDWSLPSHRISFRDWSTRWSTARTIRCAVTLITRFRRSAQPISLPCLDLIWRLLTSTFAATRTFGSPTGHLMATNTNVRSTIGIFSWLGSPSFSSSRTWLPWARSSSIGLSPTYRANFPKRFVKKPIWPTKSSSNKKCSAPKLLTQCQSSR